MFVAHIKDESAATFYFQVAVWVPDIFYIFEGNKLKIDNNFKTPKARDKITTALKYLEFWGKN